MTSANGGREFRLPGLILTGPGCLGQTGAATAELGVNHALVVTATPLRESGAVDEATAVLNAAGIATTIFDEINAEPTTDDVEAAVATYEAAGANGVVGLGGGSALDTAKAVAVRGRASGAAVALSRAGPDSTGPRAAGSHPYDRRHRERSDALYDSHRPGA